MKDNADSRPAAPACPQADDSAAYLAGEMPADVRDAFAVHLSDCPECRRDVEANRRVIARLTAVAPARVSRDLAPDILAEVSGERRPAGSAWARIAALAAVIVLLLAGAAVTLWLHREHPGVRPDVGASRLTPDSVAGAVPPGRPATPGGSSADSAMDWLCRTQEPDGSWDARRWGGDGRFQVALTALSALTLLDPGKATDARIAAAKRAVRYLESQQNEKGEFGPAFDNAPYNQGIATLALLHACRHAPRAEGRAALDRAISAIVTRQMPDGGWGYLGDGKPESNMSVTLWQIEALKLAAELGLSDVEPGLNRGLRWVAGMADDRGFFGYRQTSDFPAGPQTLTAMGALSVLESSHGRLIPPARRQAIMARVREAAGSAGPDLDYYRAYFLTAALKQMNSDDSNARLIALRREIVLRQERDGADSGSWTPDARWGSVGGRLYSTALASLSVR